MAEIAEVRVLDETGKNLEFGPAELAGVTAVKLEAQRWAQANSLKKLTFQLQAGSSKQLGVQFDDDAPLSSWVDVALFKLGQVDQLEGQLDFVRGEHRRRLAGYSQFDR